MDHAFDADRDQVLANARAAGVAALVLVGYDLPTSQRAVELARRLSWARASVGIHPNSAAAHGPAQFAELAELARAPEVIAIGETGLDYYREYTSPARQRWALDWHITLAEELQLPLVVHNRHADADLEGALGARGSGPLPGVLHCFSSRSGQYLERMLAHGYYVSFAGPLTFKNADDLRAMARLVPLDRLLIETDSPFLAPVPHRGKPCEPAFVADTARFVANIRDLPVESVANVTLANFRALFAKVGAC
jgi:TatD DNase family protein